MPVGASATGAIRELGEALGSGPFRIALTLSVIVHGALLLGLRGGTHAPPRRPPVRVHFIREVPASPVAQAAPAAGPAPTADPAPAPADPARVGIPATPPAREADTVAGAITRTTPDRAGRRAGGDPPRGTP